MTKPTVLMTGAYPDRDMAALENDYEIIRLWETPKFSGSGVRAVLTRGDIGACKALVDRLADLQFIGCFGVGTDGIDRSAMRPRGIRIANTPDVLTEDVADIAFALMLAVARKVVKGDAFARDGRWVRGNLELVTRVNGKRLGIIGAHRQGDCQTG